MAIINDEWGFRADDGSESAAFAFETTQDYSSASLNKNLFSIRNRQTEQAAVTNTGAWKGPIIDKGGQVYNVKAYGAVGDGVTDDTAAIQAAIDAAGSAPTLIPDGTFLTDRLVLDSNQTLLVQGELKANSGLTTSLLRAASKTNVRVVGIGGRITGNTESTLSGIVLDACTDAEVRGLRITAADNKGILISGTSIHCRVYGNYISGSDGTSGAGISVNGASAEHCTVYGNVLEACRIGITFNGGSLHACVGNVVRDCTLGGIFLDGIVSDSGDGAKRCTVAGNVSEGGQDSTYAGIFFGNGASYNTITGNICRNNAGAGIRSSNDSASSASEYVTIQGNICEGNSQQGMNFTRCNHLSITGNVCEGNGSRGIHAFTLNDATIVGNTCDANTSEGILVQAEDCIVESNKSRNNTYGIRSASGGSANANNWIEGNDVRGNSTANLASRSTDTVRDNQGHTTETNGTATVADGTTSVAVNHGLNVTPDIEDISVTPTNDPTNDIVNFWISGVGASQFTINAGADPGAGGATFAWTASVQ